MEFYGVVILLLAIAIGLSHVASKSKLPYPILLLAVGVGVGFIPGFGKLSVNPDVVFLIFLPPMLYDAAYNISFKDFKENMSTISALAILLIFITMTGIAVVAYYCIPDLSWSGAFVLGAILSPPDAIAASGVTKGLNLPHRTRVILEGESLVNDASALVAFRFAVAAVAGSSFVLWEAGLMFIMSLAGGFLVGFVLWFIFAFIVRNQRMPGEVTVSLNLLLPFVAYLLAEDFHVSGVIAVVTVGLIVAAHKDEFSPQVAIQSKSIWDIGIFILGGLIFLLIGLQFPHVLKNIPHEYIGALMGCAFLIFLVALIIRVAFVFWDRQGINKRLKILKRKEEIIEAQILYDKQVAYWQKDNPRLVARHLLRMFRRRSRLLKRMDHLMNYEPMSFKESLIIGWSGMRGIVSLAAAISLPLLMADGTEFPQRDAIIFLTVVTVILMLTIQGLGLPVLLKWLNFDDKKL